MGPGRIFGLPKGNLARALGNQLQCSARHRDAKSGGVGWVIRAAGIGSGVVGSSAPARTFGGKLGDDDRQSVNLAQQIERDTGKAGWFRALGCIVVVPRELLQYRNVSGSFQLLQIRARGETGADARSFDSGLDAMVLKVCFYAAE